MSFWNIFGIFAASDKGETITKVSDNVSVSNKGVTYTTFDGITHGSDGSTFVQMGDMSSDGSVLLDKTMATGRGSVFNEADHDGFGRSRHSRLDDFESNNDPW